MTNQSARGIGNSAVSRLPFGGGTTALFEALANSPALRQSVSDQAVRTSLPTGVLGLVTTKPSGAKQSVEQVEASAKAFVDKCWKDYAKVFPEACATRANQASATPKLVFIRNQTEFDDHFGSSSDTLDMIAFVKQGDPTRVYVHSNNLAKYANKFGPNYVKTIFAHELIHCLTNAVNERLRDDRSGESGADGALRKSLDLYFFFDSRKSPGILSSFSVQELVTEFAAEHFANKVTGIQSFSVAYVPVRATGKKLLQLVGEQSFRKAVFENNPVAYRRVIAAATTLQKQNVRTNILSNRAEDVTEMRAAQAAAPLGKPLTAASAEKLQSRYLRESKLYENLKENFPEQIKNFDFRFFKAVNAHLASRGSHFNPDLGDAGLHQLAVAIRSVWRSLK